MRHEAECSARMFRSPSQHRFRGRDQPSLTHGVAAIFSAFHIKTPLVGEINKTRRRIPAFNGGETVFKDAGMHLAHDSTCSDLGVSVIGLDLPRSLGNARRLRSRVISARFFQLIARLLPSRRERTRRKLGAQIDLLSAARASARRACGLRICAVKNSKKRWDARSPPAATLAGAPMAKWGANWPTDTFSI